MNIHNESDFRVNSARAVEDKALRTALRKATATADAKRIEALKSVPDFEELRDQASAIRSEVLDNLEYYLDQLSYNAQAKGAQVHRAQDAGVARNIIVGLLRERGVAAVVKSKSMISEEIHLNSHLEQNGVSVVETDLGEFIIQLAGERPSHVTAPAIHKTRQQVGRLFSEKLGVRYTDDIAELTRMARQVLRERFLTAQAGITGANFAVAQTGSLVLFTNEGNGRLVAGIPRLHIAVLSIEKIVPTLADLSVLVQLLPRSATGQTITSYLSLITGIRRQDEVTGPDELHIVLLDNGRRRILSGQCREILKCIRCGACLNVCPVYSVVGGHSYDATYAGPMGIVLTALIEGLERRHALLDASTLCGACDDVCPVRVPLVKLLATLRRSRRISGLVRTKEQVSMRAFGLAVGSPRVFSVAQKVLRCWWPLLRTMKISPALGRLPRPVRMPFHRRSW